MKTPQELYDLKHDWDGYGSPPPKKESIDRLIEWVKNQPIDSVDMYYAGDEDGVAQASFHTNKFDVDLYFDEEPFVIIATDANIDSMVDINLNEFNIKDYL